MNKYSEVNKKETLLENVSFVSSGEDRKTSIEISKRWITLTLCLLLLSTIVGCVGLFIGFRRIETQEMKAFEEILKVVGERKHDAVSKGNETVSVEDLAEQPKVRTKRSSSMRRLYCHEGETFIKYLTGATLYPVGGVAVSCAIPFLNLFTCLPAISAISSLPFQVEGSTRAAQIVAALQLGCEEVKRE